MDTTYARIYLSYESSSKTRTLRQITVNLTFQEITQLEKYCSRTGKTVTDVIRALIDELPTA